MPDPEQNALSASELRAKLTVLTAKGEDAGDSLEAYEQAPPPPNNEDPCADLQAFKEKLQDMISAVDVTMAELGCGA